MKSKNTSILYLSPNDVSQCLPSMKEAVDLIENVFVAHAEKRAILPNPHKLFLNLRPNINGNLTAIPGFIEGKLPAVAGIKWLSSFPDNPLKGGLPSITALLILNDPVNGLPIAIMGASDLSAMRTGAASGVGIRNLGVPSDVSVALIGASAQGRYQLRAALSEASVKEIRVFDILSAASHSLVNEMQEELGVPMMVEKSAQAATEGANLIIIATTAIQPHFKAEWCEKCSLLIDISTGPDLFPEVIAKADKIVVDNRESQQNLGCLAPSIKSGHLKIEDLHADLAQIVTGARPGRQHSEEFILCVPLGLGTEDVAIAQSVFLKAQENNIGTKLPLF